MSGFISIDREMIKHPIVGASHPKRMAAWLWMLVEARWKPTTVLINGKVVELQRGELSYSLRHLAKETGLSVKETRTFLKLLILAGMVLVRSGHEKGTAKGTARSVITICNYDKYQDAKNQRAQPKAIKGHKRGTRGAQEGHNTKRNKDERRMEEGKKEKNPQTPFDQFWKLYPNKVGKGPAEKSFSKALGLTDFKTLMVGLEKYVRKDDYREWCHPTTWLNGKRWLDEPATVQMNGSAKPKDTPANAAMRRLREMQNGRSKQTDDGDNQSRTLRISSQPERH